MFSSLLHNEAKRQKRMVCPKCASKMVDVGALTVRLPGIDPQDDMYCNACFHAFIAANVPKFVDPKVDEPEEPDVSQIILSA